MSNPRETLRILVGTCLGLGYAPVAPATFAALLGVAIFLIVLRAPQGLHTPLLAAALALFVWLNHLLTPWAERKWNCKDPQKFVLDEVAGYLTTVLLFRGGPDIVQTVLWTFVLTRVLDMIKLPPARQLESLPGSWGIVLDDIASSLYAVVLLHGVRWWFPRIFGGVV